MMKKVAFLALLLIPISLLSQTSYRILSGTTSQGGGFSSSSQYRLIGITGVTAVGNSYNSGYKLHSGMPYQAILFGIQENPFPERPLSFRFFPPYPNPMHERVAIAFVLPQRSDVELDVYDISGRRVWTCRKPFPSGRHVIKWRGIDNYGRKLANGLYILRFKTADHLVTHKLLILR
ncbi:MAG: hypothetical protein DRQ10_03395 [Candidatus Hydrothermota bacterium]|nr:MAG: hypothetical protein DRQ10_03395 [Candidatus Hydrothermae bacterium]